MHLKASEIAMIGVCAALYAVIGRLTDLGIVAPAVGVVAFWPAVIIPAVFAVLFGPWTGGFGAAIGIFIRDVMFHGNALLSLSAGVTSNFAMFALLGYISRKETSWKKINVSGYFGPVLTFASLLLFAWVIPNIGFFNGPWLAGSDLGYLNSTLTSLCFIGLLLILIWAALRPKLEVEINPFLGGIVAILVIGLSIAVPLLFLPPGTGITGLTPFDSMLLFVGVITGSILLIAVIAHFLPEWENYGVACVVGLGVGSTIIGLVLWGYSQILPLPGGAMYAPNYFILLWIVWTFTTEIPFLIVIGPPILKAVYKAFPSLKPQAKESK